MPKLVITLEEADILELQGVLIDEDPAGALHFLKRHIAPKIPPQGTALCDSSRLNPYLMQPNSKEQDVKSLEPLSDAEDSRHA